MDAFVESLPDYSNKTRHEIARRANSSPAQLYIIGNSEFEGNVMTTVQVAAAKEKSWTPYYNEDGENWQEYEGNDSVKGDVNGDGVVNVTDIVATVNYIMEKPSDGFNKEAADLNGDGEINVTDIVKMVTIIMSGGSRQDLQEVMSILKSHGFIFKGER